MNTSAPLFNILLVEDEPADANLVRVALSENHFLAELRIAPDARCAMALPWLRKSAGIASA